jgi:hypothetical protein
MLYMHCCSDKLLRACSGNNNIWVNIVTPVAGYLSTVAFSQFTAVTRENQGNHNKQGPFGEAEARIWGAQVKG